jgi:hypothetical protein
MLSFDVLTAVQLRTPVFCGVMLRCWASEFFRALSVLEEEGTTILQNVRNHSPRDTASQPRRSQSSTCMFQPSCTKQNNETHRRSLNREKLYESNMQLCLVHVGRSILNVKLCLHLIQHNAIKGYRGVEL